MSLKSFFARKRLPDSNGAPQRYVKGTILGPGAEAYAYEPTTADPTYLIRVFPEMNFTPMKIFQPEQDFQFLAVPPTNNSGSPWVALPNQGLISEDDLPDVQGKYYQ